MHWTAVLKGLDADWRALVHSPQGRAALIRWARREPILEGVTDLSELLSLRRRPEWRSVLHALAGVAAFDDTAARVLLQALLPGLIQVARRERRRDPDALQEIVGLAWELIRTYPPERPGSVAANIVLDVQKRYRSDRRSPTAPTPEPIQRRSVEEIAIDRVMVDQVLAACRTGVIAAPAVRLIFRSRLHDEALDTIAAEQAIDVHCVETRRRRAEQRLRHLLRGMA